MKARSNREGSSNGGEISVTIEEIGDRGDGFARLDGTRVYVPFTVPGDRIRARRRGQRADLIAVDRPSLERIEPVCGYFGVCGGCALQHWRHENYAAWKEGLVKSALARQGIDAVIEPLRSYPNPSRRRAAFSARKTAAGLLLGYKSARSHNVVDLQDCPILMPAIRSALPHLKSALGEALETAAETRIHLTAAVNGLDCVIKGPSLAPAAQLALIGRLASSGIIRVMWNNEAILFRVAPFVNHAGVEVMLPQGQFLQAIEACEQDMASFVVGSLATAKEGPVCDLFSGSGAFTFPVAKFAEVMAFEENAAAVAALNHAARAAKGIKPAVAIRRDLFRMPLGRAELKKFKAVVMDPPREGAEAQCQMLASSNTTIVVMLSCDPSTFARDAAILIAGGFKLSRVAVFDQFKFSAHVESAAAFVRE